MKESDAISLHNKETIIAIRRKYGAKIRAYRENDEFSVYQYNSAKFRRESN